MAHTAFDAQEISFVDQNLANEDLNQNRQQMESLRDKFALFLRDWTRNHAFIYRDQLISQLKVLTIDLEDLNAFDNELFRAIKRNPDDTLLQFEAGARKAFAHLHPEGTVVPEFQVSLHSSQLPISLRELHSDLIGRLLVIPGIIVSATKPQVKAKTVVAQCKGCQEKITIPVAKGFSGVQLPRNCNQRQRNEGVVQDKCPLDPYSILPDECQFTDQQLLRLQELVEHVPTGEMPRSVTVIVDRNLVDNVSPGNRVTIIGTFSVGAKGKRDIVRNSYLRVIGIMSEQQEEKRFLNFFSPEDEEKYHAMARDPEIYTKIAQSIAPSIYGNEDIKKAIACLLFGGSRKRLPDGVRLRGDINVLLLGDPSTAKSQFLKFVSRAAPIAVYTSGKGSSAAGLTASIIREGRGNEFKLEGGAMVLADGGVVCIDEFDKMRAQDRVAIHEAMEQQTISIAKAGITTILNSRVSVLAAANPSAGSYDDLKQAQEQIEFQSTILSRFDCIFLVRDQRNEEQDIKLAQHVIRLHMGGQMDLEEHADIELEDLKKYIAYTRAKCAPRLSEEAGKELQNFYVADRRKQRENTFPITVRQLEAIIRLSESIAKMSLSSIVTVQNVREAHRLFEVSTLNAASSGLSSSGAHLSPEMAKAVIDIEDYIRGHLSIGQNISVKTLEERLDSIFRNHRAIQHALHNMVRRQELKEKSNQRMLTRME